MTTESTVESEMNEANDVDGVPYLDGDRALPDGRRLSWRWWGEAGHRTVLRLQGTPASRLYRHPDSGLWRSLGVRMLMADRPGLSRPCGREPRGGPTRPWPWSVRGTSSPSTSRRPPPGGTGRRA